MLKQPQLNRLPFQGLPRLGTGQATLAPQPPVIENPNNYPFARGTELIRNTNPFTMGHNREARDKAEYAQQNAALDPALRAELEKFGDYFKRQYLALLQQGGQPNEKGETPASQYLDYLRVKRDERMQKWVDIWGHLDANTRQAYDRWSMPFREAYTDAMVAGENVVYLNVDGKDVPMRGYEAAREIYRRAIEFSGQERDRKYNEGIERAQQNPYRVIVGGY